MTMRAIILLLVTCLLCLSLAGQTPVADPLSMMGGSVLPQSCGGLFTIFFQTGVGIFQCLGGAFVPIGVPSGLLTMTTATTCPSGFAEATDLDGLTVIGTLAAHGNVGTTGGSDTITATGSVSVPTFTGNSNTTSAISAGTPAGSNSVPTFTGSAGTVPAQTFTGSSGTIPAEVISWPVGVPTFLGNAGTVPAQTLWAVRHGVRAYQPECNSLIRRVCISTEQVIMWMYRAQRSRAPHSLSPHGSMQTA